MGKPQRVTLVVPESIEPAFLEAVKTVIEMVFLQSKREGAVTVLSLLDEEYDEMDAVNCADILTAGRGVQ